MTNDQLPLWTGPEQVKQQRNDLVAQERAAVVMARLLLQGMVSVDDARELTGLTYSGVWYLMSKIARVQPCWYDREERVWRMVEQDG